VVLKDPGEVDGVSLTLGAGNLARKDGGDSQMKRSALVALLAAFALLAAACGSSEDTTTTTEEAMAEWPDTVSFGFIPSEQQETLAETVQPYMDYLSDELGITFEGVITSDYNGLVVAMGADQLDLGAFGPFGWVQAESQYPQLALLMQSIRFGSKTYHGQWFTNDPSICDEGTLKEGTALENQGGEVVQVDYFDAIALQTGVAFDDEGNKIPEVLDDGTAVAPATSCRAGLENVEGKNVAFTSATSTSGGVFPQLQLFNLGIDIENDIDYSYLIDHTSTVAGVYNGDFDIGLSFDDARRNIREDNPDVGTKVIVFNITDEIPNDVVAVNSNRIPADLQQAIFDATKAFLATPEGETIFDEIYGWTDIQTAIDADFDVVREAADKLGVSED
jgi:phosphonate transport system substrate-binding protein